MKRSTYFQLHNVIGLSAMLFIVLIAVTGALLEFRKDISGWEPAPKALPVESPLSLDVLRARAEAAGDGSPATDMAFPSKEDAPYLVYLDDDAESKVYLDGNGKVLEIRQDRDRKKLTRLLFKLHTGEILGLSGMILSLLTAISLCVLSISGFFLWWSRRKKKSSRS